MKKSTIFLLLTCIIGLTSIQAQDEHNYKFILPDLVTQGEAIRGTVIEETPEGDIPLREGDQFVFRGEVIDVEENGQIELPAFVNELGNQFITTQIVRAFGASFSDRPQEMIPQHIEILKVKESLDTQIKQTSKIIGDRFRVRGQGLSELRDANLVSDDITIPLDEPIASSSLELIYAIPEGEDIQPGEYSFEAKDKDGISYEAPELMIEPTLQTYGPQVRKRGQKGNFEITANVSAFGEILGGEPFIEIPNRFFELKKDETTKVKFIARRVGDYLVNINIYDGEDAPVMTDSPPVEEVNVEPVDLEYNDNETELTTNVNVIDNNGVPIKDAPVYMAISYPQGVEYVQIQTNNRGQAKLECILPGQLSQGVISIHPYKVAGHNWDWAKKDLAEPTEKVQQEIEIEKVRYIGVSTVIEINGILSLAIMNSPEEAMNYGYDEETAFGMFELAFDPCTTEFWENYYGVKTVSCVDTDNFCNLKCILKRWDAKTKTWIAHGSGSAYTKNRIWKCDCE